MEPVALLGRLAQAGVELHPAGDRLRFRPRSAVTPDLLSELAEHKHELVRLLTSGPGQSQPYDCGLCREPVKLVLSEPGDMWTYRCACGNRAKVAVRDYGKLRAFDRLLAESRE